MRSCAARLAVAIGLAAAVGSAAASDPGACPEIAILASPAAPVAGTILRIVVAGGGGSPDDVLVEDPAGRVVDEGRVSHGGPPWSVVTTIDGAASGMYRVALRRGERADACGGVFVPEGPARAAPERIAGAAWPSRREWSAKMEALYVAWVEHLFAAPPDAELAFPSLEPVLRDPARNFLYDHLGLGEDGPRAFPTRPDCADLPYLLRAYFAWKLGLAFGFRHCTAGTATDPPRCGALTTNQTVGASSDPVGAFAGFARALMDGVHSASARTALDDDATDFYPVPLARAALRPGTIFADPYGHTLVLVGWVAQTAERPGMLLAVDAQPDDTVARKRFWEGTFLFAPAPNAGPGFKAFRPLVREDAGGQPRPLANAELANDGRFTPWSPEQRDLDPATFYARVGRLVNPGGLAPERAYEATLDALVEQLETRVRSVDNGEAYVRAHPGAVIPMPEGAAIFETSGPWEDYATPSRDFRLIIAMNVLAGLPARIVRHPELFVLGERTPGAAAADVGRLHARAVAERSIAYTRSDGSPWRLTVADALARKGAFETAYDPNDCVEVRWGAPEGSEERATCRRRAPAEQRARMEEYREWFRTSRRPVR